MLSRDESWVVESKANGFDMSSHVATVSLVLLMAPYVRIYGCLNEFVFVWRRSSFPLGDFSQAMAALEEDGELAQLRHRVVPSRISEEMFWKAYFWQVSTIKQALLIDYSKANEEHREKRAGDTSQDDILAELERELQVELEGFEDFGCMSPSSAAIEDHALMSELQELDQDIDDLHL